VWDSVKCFAQGQVDAIRCSFLVHQCCNPVAEYLDDKDFELLFGTGYISDILMKVQARKTGGSASGRCLLDELLSWPYLPCAVVAPGPLSCEVQG